jgi:nitroimidazol reductase NimA-like FMN-containing flavoprotein (pyridoxamine 5'-phosphate oxidase superfamily)
MAQELLTREETIDFLAQETIGHLATFDPTGYPYITPLNYLYYQGKIYFHCAHEGRKLDNLAANNRVCFEVSRIDRKVFESLPCKCSTRYTSALVFGSAGIVADTGLKMEVLNALTETYAGGCPFPPVEAASAARCTVVEITIDAIEGKRNTDPTEV